MSEDPQERQDQPPRRGMSLGAPFGVPVRLSWTWFAGALVITWLFIPIIENRLPAIGDWAVVIALCFAVLLGLSVLVHEMAHALAALRLGQRVRAITLHLLGGVSEIEGDQRKPWVDFAIAAVGPLASLALAAVGYGLTTVLPDGSVSHLVAWQLTVANLLVGIFNLFPGLPLDGGRMLRDVVWAATGRESTGTVAAAWTGRALAVGLVILAVLPILRGENDVIWLVWGLLLASFIWIEAGRALTTGRLRAVLPQVDVRALTRRAIPVPQDLAVSEGLRRLAAVQAGAIVTIDASSTPVGVVNEASVAALPDVRRPWVPLSAVARTLPTEARVSADLDGEALISHLTDHPAAEYLVVDGDGVIFGVLSQADVGAAINSLAGQRS